jgi:hydroxymethylpyrimidine/phosphomethylpyrimidine kinase
VTASKGRVLIVAGSDSGGGAGLQADLKTVAALGGYGMTAITALTAQNTLGVFGVHPVPSDFVVQQMRVVLDDIGADAIKIGMLGSAEIAEAVTDVLESPPVRDIPLILDPVLASTSGHALIDMNGLALLRKRLVPRACLVTPNLGEAEILTGIAARDVDGMRRAAAAILAMGAANVLIKGGHLDGDVLTDMLVNGEGEHIFRHQKIDTRHTHGTGCTLASAIATGIAQGAPLLQAVSDGCAYVQAAILAAPGLGLGHGPLGRGA